MTYIHSICHTLFFPLLMCLQKNAGWATQYMANTWLLMEQQKAAALRICSWWMSVWRTCGTPFFPDTMSRPQTTPHENDPNENCKHSCEGQIHFLEHLSHWDLMSFISPFASTTDRSTVFMDTFYFCFKYKEVQRQKNFLRDNFPKRCICNPGKEECLHIVFFWQISTSKWSIFLAEWRNQDLFAWYTVFECEVKDIIIIMLLQLWPKTGHFGNSWGLEDREPGQGCGSHLVDSCVIAVYFRGSPVQHVLCAICQPALNG